MKLRIFTKSSTALLAALAAAICLSCSAASSSSIHHHATASPTAIALPESRVTESVYRRGQVKKLHDFHASADPVLEGVVRETATTTTAIRGGAAVASLPLAGISGIVAMALIEAALKKFFKATNINFPSQLGGCMVLFVVAVLAETVHPGWGDSIHDFLAPGSALLSKWLPSFFVPGLAMLPLAPSMGTSLDVSLYLFVLFVFVYSLGWFDTYILVTFVPLIVPNPINYYYIRLLPTRLPKRLSWWYWVLCTPCRQFPFQSWPFAKRRAPPMQHRS